MNFTLLYPNFKRKAVTFSYDDGVRQDEKTIAILNRYNLKGTFNLNSAQSGTPKFRNGIDCSHLDIINSKALYEGHEIATHTKDHPHLEGLSYDAQTQEYVSDIVALGKIFGHKIHGSAYPYGTYDENTIRVLKNIGLVYARTTKSTHSFALPSSWLLWHPTCHHNDPALASLSERFFHQWSELSLFCVWGHSYEFALNDNFELLDGFCKDIASNNDIYSGTNFEIFDYVNSAEMLYYRGSDFVNPSSREIFFECGGNLLAIKPHSRLPYKGETL